MVSVGFTLAQTVNGGTGIAPMGDGGQALCVPHYLQSSEHLGQVYRAGVWDGGRLADLLR